MKYIIICLSALIMFGSCHSDQEHAGTRGEECMIMMLLPETPFSDNDVVDDVIQQLTDKSVETGINLQFIEPDSGMYDARLQELLSQSTPYPHGNALLVAIDNSMHISLYETNAKGQFQCKEQHRIELYGVGYLAGLCVGVKNLNTLVMQSDRLSTDNLRYGDGFLLGYYSMVPESDALVQAGQVTGLNALYRYAGDYGYDVIITNYGVAEPWNGEEYFDFDVDYGYGRLMNEYLNTWTRHKSRGKQPSQVISLKSGYIEFHLNNEKLLSELIELHWDEAIKLEEQYVSSN